MPGLNDRYDPYDLVSFNVLNTGIYTISNHLFTSYWVNTTGKKIQIVASSLWIGMFYGCRADCSVQMLRDADGALINEVGWDHYADPTGPNSLSYRQYWPYGFYLYPGDRLRMGYTMSVFQGVPGATHYGAIWCPAGV